MSQDRETCGYGLQRSLSGLKEGGMDEKGCLASAFLFPLNHLSGCLAPLAGLEFYIVFPCGILQYHVLWIEPCPFPMFKS